MEIIEGKRPTRAGVASQVKLKTKGEGGRGHPAREKKEAARLKKMEKKRGKKEVVQEIEEGVVVGRVRELFI